MAKEKEGKNKVSLLSYDPVETPEEIIDKDKDIDRRAAFRDAYKKVMSIIPEYFIKQTRKRKPGTSGGGTSFTQNIIITPENTKVETKEISENQREEEKEREE